MRIEEHLGAVTVISVMKEFGLDIGSSTQTQLDRSKARDFDTLIIMAERETVPDWLLNDKRVVWWTVEDPKGKDIATTRAIRDEIKRRIDRMQPPPLSN